MYRHHLFLQNKNPVKTPDPCTHDGVLADLTEAVKPPPFHPPEEQGEGPARSGRVRWSQRGEDGLQSVGMLARTPPRVTLGTGLQPPHVTGGQPGRRAPPAQGRGPARGAAETRGPSSAPSAGGGARGLAGAVRPAPPHPAARRPAPSPNGRVRLQNWTPSVSLNV